jgi:hypothetical protein
LEPIDNTESSDHNDHLALPEVRFTKENATDPRLSAAALRTSARHGPVAGRAGLGPEDRIFSPGTLDYDAPGCIRFSRTAWCLGRTRQRRRHLGIDFVRAK